MPVQRRSSSVDNRVGAPGAGEVDVHARLLIAGLVVLAVSGAEAQRGPGEVSPLPVRRVILYKSGVGFFEHLGSVTGNADVTIQFTTAQLNDVLQSLTTIDLDGGAIVNISYNSIAPIELIRR